MDMLEEINSTTRDEYGLKAGGLLHALEAFSTLFGLKLAHLLFSVAEQVSSTLQSKDITLKGALVSVSTAKKYYLRIRADNEFERFYSATTQLASKYGIIVLLCCRDEDVDLPGLMVEVNINTLHLRHTIDIFIMRHVICLVLN